LEIATRQRASREGYGRTSRTKCKRQKPLDHCNQSLDVDHFCNHCKIPNQENEMKHRNCHLLGTQLHDMKSLSLCFIKGMVVRDKVIFHFV